MSPPLVLGLTALVYVLIVGGLGLLAARRSSRSPEEYFLAGRGLGTAVLFMALFGTNCTSFVLVGIPGLAYRHGLGVFGLNAAIVALGVPLTFFLIGVPARRMGQRLGALTPAELLARRLESKGVGLLLFGFFTLYTIPYMVQGVKGAAVVLGAASDGRIAPAWAGLGVMAVVYLYTSLGGMRGTAWTNVFQGLLFLLFMLVAFATVPLALGGFGAAMERARELDPDLLRLHDDYPLFEPRRFASWGLVISTTVIAFPHMLVRLMAGSGDRALKSVCRLYPVALVLLWVPAVMLGVWCRAAVPDLEDPDRAFSTVAAELLPAVLQPMAFLAVLAAVMSTLDAQILTLSSMLLRDGLRPFRASLEGRREVHLARGFTLAVAVVVYLLSLTWGESVFDISRKAFEGYTTLVPTLFLGLRWRRFTAAGALASLLAGNGVLLLSWTGVPLDLFGFLPVFWAFLAATTAGLVASRLSRGVSEEGLRRAFGDGPGR